MNPIKTLKKNAHLLEEYAHKEYDYIELTRWVKLDKTKKDIG